MENKITFDITENCNCILVSNVCTGGESITLYYEAETYDTPKIQIAYGGVSEFHDLTVENGVAVFRFDLNVFDTTTTCSIQYTDTNKIGTWFEFVCEQGGDLYEGYTVVVEKEYSNRFDVLYIPKNPQNIKAYSDDFIIDDHETLHIKSVKNINVTKTGDLVTKIDLLYEDETEKSIECEYDSDDNLIKFGDLPINWSV